MDGNDILQDLQARTRKLRGDLEVLSGEIQSQLAENERHHRRAAGDDADSLDEGL